MNKLLSQGIENKNILTYYNTICIYIYNLYIIYLILSYFTFIYTITYFNHLN